MAVAFDLDLGVLQYVLDLGSGVIEEFQMASLEFILSCFVSFSLWSPERLRCSSASKMSLQLGWGKNR